MSPPDDTSTTGLEDLIPPDDLRLFVVGPAPFKRAGQTFLRQYIELCELQPDDSVLEVGCGLGRMAIPIAGYLTSEGRYEGFDVMREAIDWCNQHIASRCPNFRFQVADVHNEVRYNPTGKVRARDYTFPYPADEFDFVLCHSVFTHMFKEDVAHYISEIARVTRSGGRFYATFFLLNEDSLRLIDAGSSSLGFPEDHGTYRLDRSEVPEGMVAHWQDPLLTTYGDCGFRIRPLHYGWWPGRDVDHALTRQDVIIADYLPPA